MFKHQISHLAIKINDDRTVEQMKHVATNIFASIFVIFTKLNHLEFEFEDTLVYPPLSFIRLPSTTCYSSTIFYLNVRVTRFDDCLRLLDGRLSELHTFIVKVNYIENSAMTLDNKVNNFELYRKYSVISIIYKKILTK
jgi:hypothetical protein